MSEERISALEERLAELASKGGASITVQDPRVNAVTRWTATLMGGAALLIMGWVASSINRLNENVARLLAQGDAIVATQKDHSDRLKELERRRGP